MPANARAEPAKLIPAPATLGLLGGGQLGRFFVQAAHELGYSVWVLDPDPASPAGCIADRHLAAAYDDRVALDAAMAAKSDALAASVVVAAGLWLPYVGRDIAQAMAWQETFVGTLFVAFADRRSSERIRKRLVRLAG